LRITFVIYSLSSGGAEKVLTNLANDLVKKSWSVTVITLTGSEESPFFFLDHRIQWISLGMIKKSSGKLQGLFNNISRLRALRKHIKASSPDVVVSFIDMMNVATLLATFGLGIPVIVSERSNPRVNPIGPIWRLLRRLSYPLARTVVFQTAGARDVFTKNRSKKAFVIPNPIFPLPCSRVQSRNEIIAVGRLGWEKRFELLIEAFSLIHKNHPDWKMTIWGEGPQRTKINRLIKTLGLEERVFLPGRTKEISKKLPEAKIFALSSLFEGFPNALGEAMAAGLAVISFDCDFGPRALIRDGKNGILVPTGDVKALSVALGRLMADESLRSNLAKQATEITKRFSPQDVFGQWERLLLETSSKRPALKDA